MTTKLNKRDMWVLRQLHDLGYTTAIIAGGAVRDSYFSKPIKDVDIFYWVSEHNDVENSNHSIKPNTTLPLVNLFELDKNIKSVSTVYTSSNHKQRKGKPNTSSCVTGYGSRHVQSIINIYKNGQTYQLIGLNIAPLEFVNTYFDINLCRCWCDGTRMRYPSAFQQDAMNKTITVAGNLTYLEYKAVMKHHVPRIQRKYPDFVVVDTLKAKFTNSNKITPLRRKH